MIPPHVDIITRALENSARVQGLFLGGSHGTGLADQYSDIDFLLVTDDGPSEPVSALWKSAVEATGEIVLWWDRLTRPSLINAITADWIRTDVVILTPDQFTQGAHRQDNVIPLLDPAELYPSLPPKTAPENPVPRRVLYQIEEFIRILGLLPLAVGRKEYLNGVLGLYHLRNLLVDVMIQETAAPHRGGILHLNRLTTPEQREVLHAMPVPVPDHDAIISGHLAYAAAYLPRARKMAGQIGVTWPDRFEEVTWQRLDQTLGLKRPY